MNLPNQSYLKTLEEYPKSYRFLKEKGIIDIERIYSLWRKENLVLKIDCHNTSYVFKKIADEEKESEIERAKILKREYPDLMPDFFIFEGNSYIMKHIEGDSFFGLNENEKNEKVYLAGKRLKEIYSGKNYVNADISKKVEASFQRYRKKSARFFLEDELRLKEEDFKIFRNVSIQPSHNDTNAANLLYERGNEKGIKLIDPHDVGFNDIARDVGRYCASCFFNNYDYFGQDKIKSLEIAEAFLCVFNDEILRRTKYYIGESFISFLNFDTVSVSKHILKRLSENILQKKGNIIKLMEGSI